LARAPLLTTYRWNRSGSLRSIALPWVVDATFDGTTIFSVVLMKRRRSLAFISFPYNIVMPSHKDSHLVFRILLYDINYCPEMLFSACCLTE